MSTEDTLPPKKPNTPRVWLQTALAWCKVHPDYAWPLAAFGVGFLLGAIVI